MSELETTMTSGMDAQAAESAGCLPCYSSRRSEKPCYTNGLTTDNTYLVVAVNEQHPEYNALGVRNLGGGSYKLHFWPNIRPFSLKVTPHDLYRRDHAGLSNGPYDGCHMNQTQLVALLNELHENLIWWWHRMIMCWACFNGATTPPNTLRPNPPSPGRPYA